MSNVIHDALNELRASGSQSAGTEYGTGKALGPTQLVKAVAIVTAVESGGTLTLNLQGSDDDSTYYDIPGSNFLDPADGAVIDAVGKYEVYCKTGFRYVRTKGVVATAAITYQVLLTTPEK